MHNNIFPTTEQEVQRAANELYEIKSQIDFSCCHPVVDEYAG